MPNAEAERLQQITDDPADDAPPPLHAAPPPRRAGLPPAVRIAIPIAALLLLGYMMLRSRAGSVDAEVDGDAYEEGPEE